MPMKPKPLKDAIEDVELFNRRLLAHLVLCRQKCSKERECMLLDFLVERQEWLTDTFESLEKDCFSDAQEAWFYIYTDDHSIVYSRPEEIPFHRMGYDDICKSIKSMNDQVVEFLEYLHERSESKAPEETTQALLDHALNNMRHIERSAANKEAL